MANEHDFHVRPTPNEPEQICKRSEYKGLAFLALSASASAPVPGSGTWDMRLFICKAWITSERITDKVGCETQIFRLEGSSVAYSVHAKFDSKRRFESERGCFIEEESKHVTSWGS